MRCRCCDVILSSKESTRKHAITGEYLDLCNACTRSVFEVSPIPIVGDLSSLFDYEDIVEESYDEYERF